jgi:hypothetical protein
MTKKDIPLMDRVHAWTFENKHTERHVTPDMARIQRFYRDKLKVAQRFTLEDDSVRLISALSRNRKHFPGWSFLARLPYDVIWIEYDNFVKLKIWQAMGTLREPFNPNNNDTPARMGYLMYKEEPGKSQRWIGHDFAYLPHFKYGPITVGILNYVFDPEGDARFPVRGTSTWKLPTISMIGDKWAQPINIKSKDGTYHKIHVDPELIIAGMYDATKEDEGTYTMPDWLSPRLAVTVDPWWNSFINAYKLDKKLYNSMNMELSENAGHFRWIMTMLATINSLPRSVHPAHSHPGKHTVGMHQLPYFGSSTISLIVPRKDAILRSAIERLDRQANDTKRRWHMVIGHWRVIEYNKGIHFCKHIPVMQEEDLALCERCGMLVRWIPAHGRGDATVGVVDHQYMVKT